MTRNFEGVPARPVQLVLQYDGSEFSGWQRQAEGRGRTVQGVIEDAVARLFQERVTVRGAGRTDAGVHAIGQSADVLVPEQWELAELRRALNAVLPPDVRVDAVHEMRSGFDARRHAVSRSYSYWVAPETEVESPFRRRSEWAVRWRLDDRVLRSCAEAIVGNHSFRSFAVRGTAPPTDDHRCTVLRANWRGRPGGLVFEIEANRFLHHMVRFLVGTMVEFATDRRGGESWRDVLAAEDNSHASAPAPAHALFLERVQYPADTYAVVPSALT
jgi:tRNA pseudouridine38-40 synthase